MHSIIKLISIRRIKTIALCQREKILISTVKDYNLLKILSQKQKNKPNQTPKIGLFSFKQFYRLMKKNNSASFLPQQGQKVLENLNSIFMFVFK